MIKVAMSLIYRILFGITLLLLYTSNPQADPPVFDLEQTKACEATLHSLGVKFKLNAAIDDGDGCGSPRPLNIKSLKGGIKIKSDTSVNIRCETALALASWVSQVVTPSAKLHLDAKPTTIYLSTTYKCRHRNGNVNAKISEHAYANAIDFLGVGFDNGESMKVMIRDGDSDATRAFQAAIRGGSCAYFTTVIGPMTNDYHSDHLHLDLAERKGGYRLCE